MQKQLKELAYMIEEGARAKVLRSERKKATARSNAIVAGKNRSGRGRDIIALVDKAIL
jgi:hypothetical protein